MNRFKYSAYFIFIPIVKYIFDKPFKNIFRITYTILYIYKLFFIYVSKWKISCSFKWNKLQLHFYTKYSLYFVCILKRYLDVREAWDRRKSRCKWMLTRLLSAEVSLLPLHITYSSRSFPLYNSLHTHIIVSMSNFPPLFSI
jgi:hypothetical protein